VSDLKFAVSAFAKGGLAGCFVALVGPRDEISNQVLVSRVCGTLADFQGEIDRLKRELDEAGKEAQRHFEAVRGSN